MASSLVVATVTTTNAKLAADFKASLDAVSVVTTQLVDFDVTQMGSGSKILVTYVYY